MSYLIVPPLGASPGHQVGLPVLLVTRFRTPKEAVSLVNCVRGRTGVCLWTENLACALELATQFRVASVFVNMPPTLDPAAEFGGVGVSGVGRVGGRQVRLFWGRVCHAHNVSLTGASGVPFRPDVCSDLQAATSDVTKDVALRRQKSQPRCRTSKLWQEA